MISFLQFLEQQDDKSKVSYIDALGDELGIDPEDFYKEPQYASFFAMDKNGVNLGAYSIESFKKNSNGEITHAVVVMNGDKTIKNKKYIVDKDSVVQVPAGPTSNRFIVPIGELEKLMTQSVQPAQQPTDAI